MTEKNARRARKRFLWPMTQTPYAQIHHDIDTMTKRRAQAVLRAMLSCGRTNCRWVEYGLAQDFMPRVRKRLQRIEYNKAHPADGGSAVTSEGVDN